jgi:hypothetical protein
MLTEKSFINAFLKNTRADYRFKNPIERYDPHDSYIRLYDAYRLSRNIAKVDTFKHYDGSDYLPSEREYYLKKCKRLLHKLTQIRTYQKLIESDENLNKVVFHAMKGKPNFRIIENSELELIINGENEVTMAILRVIAGVINLTNNGIAQYVHRLGKTEEFNISSRSYELAMKLEASLQDDGIETQSIRDGFLNRVKKLVLNPRTLDKNSYYSPYDENKIYHIPASKKHSVTKYLLIYQITLLSKRYLKYKHLNGKNRFPAEAIHFILKYIDGSNVDKRSIQKIQSRYDQEIIDGYYDEGRDELARAFRVIPRKHSGNAT